MARPRKQGLGYFTLDCTLDSKIDMLLAVHGNDGFAVWIRALQEIYQTPNGLLDLNDKIRLATFARRCLLPEEKVMEIMIFMATKPVLIWDENLYQKRNLFSSNGVAKRFKRVGFIREQARQRFNNKRVKSDNSSTNNPVRNESQNGEELGIKPNINQTKHKPNNRGIKKECFSFPPELLSISGFSETWERWEQSRREKKKPLTDSQRDGQCKNLLKWGKPIEVLEKSIANGWTGLFEITEFLPASRINNGNGNYGNKKRATTTSEQHAQGF